MYYKTYYKTLNVYYHSVVLCWVVLDLYYYSNNTLKVQVPKEWKLDEDWEGEVKAQQMSHLRRFPSKWRAATAHQDPIHTVKIVDRFVIGRTDKNENVTPASDPVQ